MSILIKGLGMPKRCLDCPCFDHDYAECQVCVTATRENGCPLVEVPEPHGRLIDADKLMAESERYYIPKVDIEEAPTVIEAEEQEHGCGKSEEEKE